jgi:hypothetical protein
MGLIGRIPKIGSAKTYLIPSIDLPPNIKNTQKIIVAKCSYKIKYSRNGQIEATALFSPMARNQNSKTTERL